MKKKLLLIIILTIISISNINAQELPIITVGSYNAYIGENIEIPVNIENNPGISYIGFKITYDYTSLKYIKAEMIGLKEFSIKEVDINEDNIISMYAISLNENITYNGEILKLKFKVEDEAKNSVIRIEVTDFGNIDLENIEYVVSDGKVNIFDKVNKEQSVELLEELENIEKDVKWKSSNESVAIVDEEGNVTFKENGEVNIQAIDEKGNIILEKKYIVEDSSIENEVVSTKNNDKNNFIVAGIIFIILTITLIIKKLITQKFNKNF